MKMNIGSLDVFTLKSPSLFFFNSDLGTLCKSLSSIWEATGKAVKYRKYIQAKLYHIIIIVRYIIKLATLRIFIKINIYNL